MKLEEFYIMNKYKRKENRYKKLTDNTLYLYGIKYTLWNNYFFKGRRLYIEELVHKDIVHKRLRGKISRFICPTYYYTKENKG